MNELIKRLKNEAQETCGEGLGGYYYRLNENKFVELIVKECIASCLEVKDEYLRQGRDAQEEAFLVAAVDDCISNINQHFGVK